MKHSEISSDFEKFSLRHCRLDTAEQEDRNHFWQEIIKIEEIKKAGRKKKHELLKKTLKFS